VIKFLWEKLGIGEALRSISPQKGCQIPDTYEQALLAMTANRLCEPESKLGVWDRWLSKVYLPSCDTLKLDHMYEAMDHLYDHAASVEKSVFFHTADLFNQEVDLIFYDTTTASFSIDQEDEDVEFEAYGKTEVLEPGLRKYGHPKEGTWTPQVVVALAVTRAGLPVRCWVFPGNTSDVSTVKQVRQDLRRWKLGRALFVADSGMNSEENRAELARACGKYLLASRMAGVAEVKRHVLTKPGKYKMLQENLHAKEVVVGDGERRRRYILCFNPKEAKRQRNHRVLSQHKENKATAQWAIDLLASRRYKRYLRITKGNRVVLNRMSIKEAEKYDGKWVIETNDENPSYHATTPGDGMPDIRPCFFRLNEVPKGVKEIFKKLEITLPKSVIGINSLP
jgi:hypothetical protein